MTKKIIISLLLLYSFAICAKYANEENQEKMQALKFLIGDWQGTGWMFLANKQKMTFIQTEKIEWKLDKTIILIEGKGLSQDSNDIIHHALAVVTWIDTKQLYQFSSNLADGRGGVFEAKTNQNGDFIWWTTSTNGTRRFTIKINEKGEWFEIGEFSKDGEKWFQFFEMTLKKL